MLEFQIKEFKRYYETFDTSNTNISRKFHHSIRVMNFAIEIAKSLNLEDNQIRVVALAGLLHDIGRFKQWEQYNTYSDLKSIDHAELGYAILQDNDYINTYTTNEKEKNIILKAVYNHNKYCIDENLNNEEKIICNIIRDADKLDIIEQLWNEITDNIAFNKDLLEDIHNKRCCLNSKCINQADKIIKQISFIYDINFEYSFKYLKQNKTLDKKFQLLKDFCPDGIDLEDIKKEVDNYINQKINIKG